MIAIGFNKLLINEKDDEREEKKKKIINNDKKNDKIEQDNRTYHPHPFYRDLIIHIQSFLTTIEFINSIQINTIWLEGGIKTKSKK
jgi:hypothetical protein